MSGLLSVTYGPMCSGKTHKACETATRSMVALHKSTVYINFQGDLDRQTGGGQDGKFRSHNPSNVFLDPRVPVILTSVLKQIDFSPFEVIVIDEAQFYPDLIEVVTQLVNQQRKTVRAYGLISDWRGQKFGQLSDLIIQADYVKQLFSECYFCSQPDGIKTSGEFKKNACFTMRDNEGAEQVKIAGTGPGAYLPVCRFHHPYLHPCLNADSAYGVGVGGLAASTDSASDGDLVLSDTPSTPTTTVVVADSIV